MALDEFSGDVALVTGGGRGIGANIARELAGAGTRVGVAARTRGQVERVAQEIGGLALDRDVSDETSQTSSPSNCTRARERSLAQTRRASPVAVRLVNATPDDLTDPTSTGRAKKLFA